MKVQHIAPAVALLLASPAAALAQTTVGAASQPIQVQSVQYFHGQLAADEGEYGVPNGLVVTFENTGDRPATEVTFEVRDAAGNVVGAADAYGLFSPGVKVTRALGRIVPLDGDGEPSQAVPTNVQFSNGDSWLAS